MPALLAYFDPGPGSLLLQAILGGVAGFIVAVRCLWESRRASAVRETKTSDRGSPPESD